MKKLLILSMTLGVGLAAAAPFKIVPARVAAEEVRRDNDATFAQSFNVAAIERAYPYVGIKALRTVPSAETLRTACANYVRGTLKTPSVAKFARIGPPLYSIPGGVYVVTGSVDSQNSYGAMIRSTFWCSMAFAGDAKGGTLYISSDVY